MVTGTSADQCEARRLQALERYDALSGEPMPELEAVVRLAAQIAGVPTATINLIDDVQQHQVATVGFTGTSSPRQEAMCAVALAEDGPLHVSDARLDPRFAGNSWVTGERGRVVFYASSQLRTSEGVAVGTLCVFDGAEHQLDEAQRQALDDLAHQVVNLLEVRRETAALRDRNADLEAFAGRLAHDLRSPLAAASGFLQLVSSRFSDGLNDKARTCVDGASAGVRQANTMLDELLRFATAGGALTPVEVQVRAVVEDVVAACHADLHDAGAVVDVAVPPGAVVRSDAGALRQLLQNLVVNAARYRHPDRPSRIRVELAGGGTDWELSVADNGRGVPHSQRERIFDVLARGEHTIDVPGTGIGLATCVRLARALGGRLTVGGEPDEGAVFALVVGFPEAGSEPTGG